MTDNRIPSFPIADLLETLGARPGKYKNTYHSPFRKDRDASLHIDPDRNIWYDHGAGVGGGNIDLVMHCKGCTASEAAEFILSLAAPPERSMRSQGASYSGVGAPRISHSAPNRIVRVRYVHSIHLLDYCESRGIPSSLAARYCREITLRGKTAGRTYESLGFLNNSGGYALKSANGFKSTTKAGVTTIDIRGDFTDCPSADVVSVFEGFFDFLSWLACHSLVVPTTDVLVLNSVANLPRGLSYLRMHRSIICCLDNDNAGRTALDTLRGLRLEIGDPDITDGSFFYQGYKDVNEWWVAMNRGNNQ